MKKLKFVVQIHSSSPQCLFHLLMQFHWLWYLKYIFIINILQYNFVFLFTKYFCKIFLNINKKKLKKKKKKKISI